MKSNSRKLSKKKSSTKKSAPSKSKMQVQGSKQAIDRMKYEIANEFGVNLGPDSSARANGQVGGEITRRLVESGLNKSKRSTSTTSSKKKSKKK